MRPGGTGSDDGMIRALESVLDRYLTRNKIYQRRRDEERADAPRSPLFQYQRRLVDGLKTADPRPDHHTGASETLFILRFPA